MLTSHAELTHDGRYHAVVRYRGRVLWESIGTYAPSYALLTADFVADAILRRCNIS